MATLRLKPGREKSVLRRHPWVFSGAVAGMEGDPGLGETVRLEDAQGQFLAWGAYSPHSQIRARVWSWEEYERIDERFFRSRLAAALAVRRELMGESDALRLVHAESDGLPGLVADRYADTLVVQFLSSGSEYWRDLLASLLLELSGAAHIYERSDVEVRRLEGLPERSGPLHGAPPERVQFQEAGLKFWADLRAGHKTGFYLDQRSNRLRLRSLACGRRVLDCFCYSGGFTLNALVGGAASVLAIDASAEALTLGAEHLALNGLPGERVEWRQGDVFQALRALRDQGQAFDLLVLDPPKFAPTASQAERAARGYKDINLLAFKLLRPGGILATFSCSGGVDAQLFQKIVAGAALDAGVQAQILERLSQAPDHPVALNFPEGQYLKGLIVRRA
ncbi:MAG: class I SAM-dependent rRNA methyltransferase [Anaerolineales bacterium]|nr:class I SAM-dependent rRNA methyltransferase [Anaerolineales bacterium]